MRPTPLFTSLPPRVRRLARDGQDQGPAWTRACIQSWQRAGYRVVSVNSAAEADSVRAAYPGIEVAEVARDGQARTGRPLIYVADLLSMMAHCNQSCAALANADVMFTSAAIERLAGWQPEGFAFSGRIDVDDFRFSNPRLHGGVDFVIAQTCHLKDLAVPDFLFGTPWWDYWLPLALTGQGVQGVKLTAQGLPVIAHLAHEERWNHGDFLANFALFSRALADQACGSSTTRVPDGKPDQSNAMLNLCMAIARATSAMIHKNHTLLELGQTDAVTP
jgi:hypothetical protein